MKIFVLSMICSVVIAIAFTPIENSSTHKLTNSSIDSCQFWHHKYDSAKVTAIMSEARLGQVRYYMKIVNRKPSQQKFLRGWINRALK